MKRISASIMALLIAIILFINVYKPSSHEQLAESPTGRTLEYAPQIEYNGFNAIYTQADENKRQQAEQERRIKRKQALEEAHRLYEAKIAEEQRRIAEAKGQAERQQISRSNNVNLPQITMIATHYTAFCEGCSGITATGIDVKRTIYENGLRVIAVDPRTIPLGSIVRVEYADSTTFKAVAGDVGGMIKGNRIDILVASESEAYQLGKQTVTVTILKYGKGR